MSEEFSRWMFVTLVMICAVPLQAAALWVHPYNTWLDWAVLAALVALSWAHLDSPTPTR